MRRLAAAALLAATLAGTPALAQEYGRGYGGPDYGRGYAAPAYGGQAGVYADGDYDRRAYRDGDDRRYATGADFGRYGYDGYGLRGEGWRIVASVAPNLLGDRRLVRWTLRNFDADCDGYLSRREGWRARAALAGYGRGW